MKSTGMVRVIDVLGRIVIPAEMRKTLGWNIKDAVEFYVDGQCVVLKKYEGANTCMLTGEFVKNPITAGNGRIVLSPEGADQLMKELGKQLDISKKRDSIHKKGTA